MGNDINNAKNIIKAVKDPNKETISECLNDLNIFDEQTNNAIANGLDIADNINSEAVEDALNKETINECLSDLHLFDEKTRKAIAGSVDIAKKSLEQDHLINTDFVVDVVNTFFASSGEDHTISCNENVDECDCMKRVTHSLSKYEEFINCSDTNLVDDVYTNLFGHIYKMSDLLNDYHHLLRFHDGEFEQIYNTLNEQIFGNKSCDRLQCRCYQRNGRDRCDDIETIFLYNDGHIAEEQILDSIHCHFLHSFDTGYRFRQNDIRQLYDQNLIISPDADADSWYFADIKDQRIKPIAHIFDNGDNKCDDVRASNMKKFVSTQYSNGYRYYYWKYYENNDNMHDQAALIPFKHRKRCQSDYDQTNSYWHVKPKHGNFKQELTNYAQYALSASVWNQVYEHSAHHHNSQYVKAMKCLRAESSAQCYEMNTGDSMQQHHVIALRVYTSFTDLQREFSSTFRRINNESIESMKERHAYYYFLARYLRECVEIFGMECKEKELTVFHGVCGSINFSSVYPYFKGPFSTTLDFAVAQNFSTADGVTLELKINSLEWRMTYNVNRMNAIWCAWISDFSAEQELLFLGGINRHSVQTIIDRKLNVNYKFYIDGLRHILYCMSDFSLPLDVLHADKPRTKRQKQMVFRLMSHEFWRYPEWRDLDFVHEFKKCPVYIKHLLHRNCVNTRGIGFFDQVYLRHDGENFVFEQFFKCKSGWVYFNRLFAIFPRLEIFGFHLSDADVIQHELRNLLDILKKNMDNSLVRMIIVQMKEDHKEKVEGFVSEVEDEFYENGWNIKVLSVSLDLIGAEMIGIDINSKLEKVPKFLKDVAAKPLINQIDKLAGIEMEITRRPEWIRKVHNPDV